MEDFSPDKTVFYTKNVILKTNRDITAKIINAKVFLSNSVSVKSKMLY